MFPSRRPEKSRRGRFWEWINPTIGKEVRGWLAGGLVGVETHYMGRTVPCRMFLTGGKLKCFCSQSKLPAIWKGYVPVLDERGVQCFAIIGERYADVCYEIPLHSPVTVARLRRAGSPVCVSQAAWTDQPPPSRGERLIARDLRPWLLKLWGDETLNEWFAAHPDKLEESADAPERRSGEVPASIRRRVEQARSAGTELPETLGDVLGRSPSANGKRAH